MAGWAAANLASRERNSNSSENVSSTQTFIRLSETPDAALARLTDSYSAAMEAISGLHKVSRMLSKIQDDSISTRPGLDSDDTRHVAQVENMQSIIKRASKAARSIMEDGILSDPMVQPFIVTLFKLLSIENIITHTKDDRVVLDTPVLSSVAQRNTLKRIIYLTLVNYADTLNCACGCGIDRCENHSVLKSMDTSILMKNIVGSLPHLSQNPTKRQACLWGEPAEVTKRLVLVSYCQAADLDGSDPMIWLKVASAARCLSVVYYTSQHNSQLGLDQSLFKFARLERFALERGLVSLPQQIPSNRCLARAYTDHFQYAGRASSIVSRLIDTDQLENVMLEVNLTSYSWAALGRLLIRVCKEGGSLRERQYAHKSDDPRPLRCMHLFGSPTLKIQIASILTLPQHVFSRLCEYLADIDGSSVDVKNLECTCRFLSAAVVSARAYSQRMKKCRLRKMETELMNHLSQDVTETEDGVKNNPSAPNDAPQQSQRLSKRLRSQVMASSKLNENVKGFCLRNSLAVVVSAHSADHPKYLAMVKESKAIEWSTWCPFSSEVERIFHSRGMDPSNHFPKKSNNRDVPNSSDNSTMVRSIALLDCLSALNSSNSGPFDALRRFLSHVSLNVCDVFMPMDEGGRIILSGCLLDCFDFLSKHSEHQSMYDEQILLPDDALENDHLIECYSFHLLHAELRLRKCERYDVGMTACDEDVNMLKTMALKLRCCNLVEKTDFPSLSTIGQSLVVRTKWLLACFDIWLSKGPINSPDVQESETLATQSIDKILSFLSTSSETVVYTPQLIGPGRIGAYWSQLSVTTLKPLRDEMQLKAVLSSCRQNFQQFVCDFELKHKADNHFVDDKLLERYGLISDDFFGRQHRELIHDFISLYGEHLIDDSGHRFEPYDPRRWPVIWDIISTTVPLEINKSNAEKPILLTIISYCLASKENFEERLISLLVVLAVECIIQIDELLLEMSNTSALSGVTLSYDWDEFIEDDESLEDKSNINQEKYLLLLSGVKYFLAKAQCIAQCGKCRLEVITRFVENGGLSFLLRIVFQRMPIDRTELRIDEEIIEMTLHFVFSCLNLLSAELRERSIYSVIVWLSHSIVFEEEYLQRQGPTYRDPLFCKRVNIFSIVANELTTLILRNGFSGKEGGLFTLHPGRGSVKATTLTALLQSLQSIWTLNLSVLAESSYPKLKVLVRGALNRMRVPIASLITAVCATISVNNLCHDSSSILGEHEEGLESDDSDSDSVGRSTDGSKVSLRILSAAVQCVGLILNNVDDKDALETFDTILYPVKNRPLLPTVAVRALGMLSDLVLNTYTSKGKWSEEYPCGFRSTGLQLDAFLCKVYRLLYGVALIPQTNQVQSTVELLLPSFNTTTGTPALSLPESAEAATQMYRCIARIYRPATGRRYPPKNALECILRSLPLEETKKAKAIRSFIWNKSDCDENILCRLETNIFDFLEDKLCTDLPPDFPTWTLLNDSDSTGNIQSVVDERELVRKGCVDFLAQGPIPGYCSNSDDMVDERDEAFKVETALSEKVNALIDSLCFTPDNSHNWFQAGLCLSIKADLLNDRLSPMRPHPHKWHDFNLSNFEATRGSSRILNLPLNELLITQFDEFTSQYNSRLTIVGDDLSFYVNNFWTNFNSLDASTQAASMICGETPVLLEVRAMFEEGKYIEWQNFWGCIFVSALQRLSKRCLLMALTLCCRNTKGSGEDDALDEEIAEALGKAYYQNVMGSVSNGYPACELTNFEKRFLAKRAIVCFELVIGYGTARGDVLRWDLHFMIGKCFEKIASTLYDESFPVVLESETRVPGTRVYEVFMKKSMQNYALSKDEAMKDFSALEKSDGGGSSHGLWEIIYRLHASRFKALLRYVQESPGRRSHAEIEALRITEENWYDDTTKSMDRSIQEDARGRIWNVYSDVVTALAQCRKENPYFHRSVFRHSQALLWAPIFLEDADEGSLTHNNLMRLDPDQCQNLTGMNCEKTCTENAKNIFEVLFDKKRPQLCAVWLTTPARPNTFESLNNSSRKFDWLRWKYCRGYIDCLRLCRDINTLQTIITWIDAVARDLPSFYDKSAANKGAPFKLIHHKENLLLEGTGIIFDLTRYANCALADVIRQLLYDLTLASTDSSLLDEVNELLYKAFKCFRRLNCSINDDTWKSLSVRKRLEEKNIAEVEAICECFLFKEDAASKVKPTTWSVEAKLHLLKKAVGHCESIFANRIDLLSANRKRIVKRKISDI